MRALAVSLITIAMLLCACGGGTDRGVRVSAAASMTDVVNALGQEYTGATNKAISTSFGASSTLAKQIHDGAPADVFISANREWVEFLKKRDHLDGEPVVIARNELVVVVKDGAAWSWQDFNSFASSPPDVVAIADEGVPAGDYARQALGKLGKTEHIAGKLVAQTDVRSVVRAVADGNADAGIVYASDALAFKDELRVDFHIDTALHDPIEYYAVLLHERGRDFFLYLQTDSAKAQLKKLGFLSAD